MRPPNIDIESTMTRDQSTRHLKTDQGPKQDEAGRGTSTNVTSMLTPGDVAARLNVTTEQVRSLIRTGRLRAINVGTGNKRPLYRLSAEVVEDFIRHGSCNRTPPTKRRAKQLGRVPDFFPRLK